MQVSGLTAGVTAISSGASHTCALLSDATVKCWGSNSSGRLGDGTTTSRTTPVAVSGLSGVASIAAGGGHTCALLSTGAVKCWGYNVYGAIGDGTTYTDRWTPTQVSGLTSGVALISAGASYTCAVTTAGAAGCWGRNTNGQLGDGTTTDRAAPVYVSGLTSGVSAVRTASTHSCAVLTTGAVSCWGNDWNGELGDGSALSTKSAQTTPVAVSGLTSGIGGVALGHNHTCALTSTGAIKCWGANNYGQLGVGVAQASTPIVASSGFSNGALVGSQASVLVQKFTAAASTISGHVMPIAYTMVNNTTGTQALMVTYDPLAAAAAMFIDQYAAHKAACDATTSESITELQQQAGTYLWACSNATAKSAYLSGMAEFLKGAKSYLYGRPDGSATAACTLAPAMTGTPAYCMDPTQAHFPYTFVVPNYTETAFNPTYYAALDTALGTYRTNILGSTASALHKSLQLAGIMKFETDKSAIVTTRVKRSGAYGATCAIP